MASNVPQSRFWSLMCGSMRITFTTKTGVLHLSTRGGRWVHTNSNNPAHAGMPLTHAPLVVTQVVNWKVVSDRYAKAQQQHGWEALDNGGEL